MDSKHFCFNLLLHSHEKYRPKSLHPKVAELPSVSPFFQDKFMATPTLIKPVTSKLLSFEAQKENHAATTGTYKAVGGQKDLSQYLTGIKKPNTKRVGDWICLKCKNVNFAFRPNCNICGTHKKDYIELTI